MRKLVVLLSLAALPLFAQNETVVLKVPGMEKAEVRKDLHFDTSHTFDLYRPNGATAALPVVVFLNGVGRPDLKEWGQYTSWPRLVATRGMAAVTHQTEGNEVGSQVDALLRYLREHAGELKIDASRIAIWSCSANGRVGTELAAKADNLRAAVFYYSAMNTAPKNINLPVFVARAGLDALSLNQGIDRWVAQAVAIDAPVTLVTYPEGRHAFELLDDTPESRLIVAQTLDFLQHHLTTAPTPRKEPMTLAQLQTLLATGIEPVVARLTELRKTHPNAYVLQEQSLNSLGYVLIGDEKVSEGTKILELVATMYPNSPNAHDSLGDAYEAAGRKEDAVREAERALALLENAPPPRREGIRTSAEEKVKRLKAAK
jgi:dienelactone hydrolase